jgi:hypothetical protein
VGITQTRVQPLDDIDDGLQLGALLSARLRLFRVVPDIRIFQLPAYLFELFLLFSIVKGTP